MANYFQTDDRDDYFSQFDKPSKPKNTVLYTVLLNDAVILNKVKGYKGITFTKTLVDKTRKSLNAGRWIKQLKQLNYTIKQEIL